MALIPNDVSYQLGNFEDCLGDLGNRLKELIALSPADLSMEDPLDVAQLHLAHAQAINVLFQLYLRTKGIDPFKHAAHKEHDRVKQYEKKVKKFAAERELQRLRPKATLNVAAANRFIDHAIPDLTAEQRNKLKQASISHQQQHSGDADLGRQRSSDAQQKSRKKPKTTQQSVGDAAVAFLEEVRAEAAKQSQGVSIPNQKATHDKGDNDPEGI